MPIQPGLHPYYALPDKSGARDATDATVAWDNVTAARVPFSFALSASEADLHLLDHRRHGTRLVRFACEPERAAGTRPRRAVWIHLTSRTVTRSALGRSGPGRSSPGR
jgi:hypothetical protein